MKKSIIFFALGAMLPLASAAQSAIDANELNGSDVRGTARFVAMGGAFTSLGGDLSTLTQNPAGLGIYRRSEIGLSFDVARRNYSSSSQGYAFNNHQTKVNFDNFGYIGTLNIQNSALRNFNWGLSYSRLNSFHHRHEGYNLPTETSLTNYIANFTTGVSQDDLAGKDPFYFPDVDWLSILAYNSYMINPNGIPGSYSGLFQNGKTLGDAAYTVEEWGYQDEYNIDFGGNVSDLVYWGIGFGIQNIDYERRLVYSESMEDAAVYSSIKNTTVTGNAGYDLDSYKSISGTGMNVKVGLILRPVDDFRIGFAIHTPTWLYLNHQGDAYVDYSYFDPDPRLTDNRDNPLDGNFSSPWYDYKSRMRSPWRFMVGASYTILNRAIVSVDYERVMYDAMRVQSQQWSSFGEIYVSDEYVNTDIKDYFKGGNIIRAGLEVRLSSQFSARAGYNYQQSHIREAATMPGADIVTYGLDPSYGFVKETGALSFGLGYRYKAWYIDMAYQWKHRSETFHAYTDFMDFQAPRADFVDNIHSFVFSTGFKF